MKTLFAPGNPEQSSAQTATQAQVLSYFRTRALAFAGKSRASIKMQIEQYLSQNGLTLSDQDVNRIVDKIAADNVSNSGKYDPEAALRDPRRAFSRN